MAQSEILKRYIEAGIAFTEATRARAEEFVKDLAKAGEVQWDQVQVQVDELVEWSRRNSDEVRGVVRDEVATPLSELAQAVGQSVKGSLAAVSSWRKTTKDGAPDEAAVDDLAGFTPPPALAGDAPAKRARTKKAAAKRAPAKKAPAQKAPAPTKARSTVEAAPPKKAAATRAPASEAPAKKATAKKAPAPAKKATAKKARGAYSTPAEKAPAAPASAAPAKKAGANKTAPAKRAPAAGKSTEPRTRKG